MSIGLGIFLIVVGAILTFALDVDLSGVDIDLIGYILMGAGAFIVLLGLVLMMRRRSVETTSRVAVDPATGGRVTTSESVGDPY